MLRALGTSITPLQLSPYFIHPLDKTKRVYAFLDICHMIKLIRNTLGDKKILVAGDGQTINWKYIVELQNSKTMKACDLETS